MSTSPSAAGLNPIYNFLEISTNEPILSSKVAPEHIDAKDDLLAPFKVHRYSRRLWAALLAEFLGLAIFQVYGGSANDDVAALANGITLAVIVYATCNVSGGHLNPAVSFASCLTGHMSWSRGGVYVIAQVLGAIFGALVESLLMPGISPGDGQGPGCFTHLKGVRISTGQLFWWECIMTFVLVSVVYATAITKPGHGSMAPLAVGFTLYASAAVAGPYTGAALNPARVFGPSLVFNCFWDTAFVYMTGQLLGGLLAAALVLPLYGFGQFGSLFDTRVLSWLGMQVPHRFQQLPESDARPPTGFEQSTFQPQQHQQSFGGNSASKTSFSAPSAPPSTPAHPSISAPSYRDRVYGNPQLGAVIDLSAHPRKQNAGGSGSQQRSKGEGVVRTPGSVNDFLPDSWKLGTSSSPRKT